MHHIVGFFSVNIVLVVTSQAGTIMKMKIRTTLTLLKRNFRLSRYLPRTKNPPVEIHINNHEKLNPNNWMELILLQVSNLNSSADINDTDPIFGHKIDKS